MAIYDRNYLGLVLNENVIPYNDSFSFTDSFIKSLSKYKLVIIGEMHSFDMVPIYDKLLSLLKFDYFIAEFADSDRSFSREELKEKMDNAVSESDDYDPRFPVCDGYNYWLYDLAYKHDIPLIGCNWDSSGPKKTKNMNDEDLYREKCMINTIKEFAKKGKCLVQLGDHHVRSIPISKEFLYFCGDTEDDRGVYKSIDDLTVDRSSPVWDAYHSSNSAVILRLKSEYDNELAFMKSQK